MWISLSVALPFSFSLSVSPGCSSTGFGIVLSACSSKMRNVWRNREGRPTSFLFFSLDIPRLCRLIVSLRFFPSVVLCVISGVRVDG